jgi:hypothetical protein
VIAGLALAISATLAAEPTARAAEPAPPGAVEGYVVELSKGDIVVDVAKDRGAKDRDTLELWRPIKLRHPVTGKIIRDRFRIGTLTLVQVQDKLSLARPDGALERQPQPGDVVILRRSPAHAPAPSAPNATPETTCPAAKECAGMDAEAQRVSALFDSLRHADVTTRIVRYEDYVRRHPGSRYAVVLYEEAANLRRLLALETHVAAQAGPELESFAPPDNALSGIPFSVGVEVSGAATGAVFHSRNAGEVAYTSVPMKPAGHGYYTVTVPAARVKPPELEFFIEATTEDGKAVPIVASADRPNDLTVHRIPTPAPPPHTETTVSLLTDYADYNNLKGNDRTWQTEGYVGMRYGDVGIRALRTGFGVYRGVGGSLEELDTEHFSGRKVGLTYGYLETEIGFSWFTSLVVRGVIGLEDDGVAGGAQALVRIGNDKKTNLLLGGEVLGGVGLRGIAELDLNSFERVPIVLRTEVTNQPAGSSSSVATVRPDNPNATPQQTSIEQGQVGARAIAQVGYRVVPGLVLAVRGSYQGRNINHSGPGFGGAVTYTW